MGFFEKGAQGIKKILDQPRQEDRQFENEETSSVTLKNGVYRESGFDLNEWEIKEEIRMREQVLLSNFFEKPILVPPIPPEVTLEQMRRWEKQGMELHFLPGEDMPRNRDLKAWKKRPERWFYDQIADGNLPPDSVRLPEGWFIIYGGQKPDYDNGKQMYHNHPLAQALAELNRKWIIKQKTYYGILRNPYSVFGLHPNDFDKPEVIDAFAKAIDIRPDQFSLPSEIIWNIVANLHHPEWGETWSWEWLKEKLKPGRRLMCGLSDYGGASGVSWSGVAGGSVGFRPLGRLS